MDGWQMHPHTNCWWDDHGATEIDEPRGAAVPGVGTVVECLRSCINVDNFECEAIVWNVHKNTCYRKGNINIVQCEQQNYAFTLYVRTDPKPAPPPAPPRQPPEPPTPPQPPGRPGSQMNHHTCEAYWMDPNSRFHDLWSKEGWVVLKHTKNEKACWGDDGFQYFDDAWWGRSCDRNWYTGTPGSQLGDHQRKGPVDPSVEPHFNARAPALLGFDETIDAYCGARGSGDQHSERCVRAGVNILSLYGDRIPYNTCRNIEWQICAAKGMLPGQGAEWIPGLEGRVRQNATIRFAFAPKHLTPLDGDRPIGNCGGFAPMGCGKEGYASSDIFYMEACVFDAICANRDSLWELDEGQDWVCQLEWEGYQKMRDWVVYRGGSRLR